jgi:hypothetical protein
VNQTEEECGGGEGNVLSHGRKYGNTETTYVQCSFAMAVKNLQEEVTVAE